MNYLLVFLLVCHMSFSLSVCHFHYLIFKYENHFSCSYCFSWLTLILSVLAMVINMTLIRQQQLWANWVGDRVAVFLHAIAEKLPNV